jgi:hypothetical protein
MCGASTARKRKEYALVARRHRVPYVHVPILTLSRPGPQRLLWLRRRDERRVCFRAWWRPVWRPLVTCGRRRVHGRRRVLVLVLVLMLLVLVLVTMRMRLMWRKPRFGRRLEHVTGNSRELFAMRWQMRVRKALLCLRWVGQDVRWGLLCERLGGVRGV